MGRKRPVRIGPMSRNTKVMAARTRRRSGAASSEIT
jgi:hypothetical protein